MPSGTSLNLLEQALPKQFFDVELLKNTQCYLLQHGLQGLPPYCRYLLNLFAESLRSNHT